MAEDTQKSVEDTENKPEENPEDTKGEPKEEKEDPSTSSGQEAEATADASLEESKDKADTPKDDPSTSSGQGEKATETVVEDITNELDLLKPGMVVRVHQKIKERTPKGDERERIQIFEGTILAKKGQDKTSATITVRKVSKGYGIERIFPLRLPTIAKIEVVKEMRTRRSKLYFLRDKRKKKKKMKEKSPKATK